MNKKTKILNADLEKDILEASSMLKKGQIVAVPTETVYGLAADARNIDAVKQIFTIKNRPVNHPLIVHIASIDQLSEWAKDIPPAAYILAKHFWPGPLSLLLTKNYSVNDIITGGLKTIVVRVPNHKALLKILNELNSGLAAPSANPYKRISPTSSQHVMSTLSGKIDAILDGGSCTIGVESTILDLSKNTISILRKGPITKKMIEEVLKISIDSPLAHLENVPGNITSHYQPYTKTSLLSLDEIESKLSLIENKDKIFGVIHYSDFKLKYNNIKTIKLSKNKEEYSRLIYSYLHELDKAMVQQILVETPPNEEAWEDILDRLSKASAT
jgi:L-threonylcarbamoyladenylate synthase